MRGDPCSPHAHAVPRYPLQRPSRMQLRFPLLSLSQFAVVKGSENVASSCIHFVHQIRWSGYRYVYNGSRFILPFVLNSYRNGGFFDNAASRMFGHALIKSSI